MAKKKQLVVDASVARAAGASEGPAETAVACGEALDAAFDHHLVVFSKEGFDEFERHASDFALRWFRRMESKARVRRHTNPNWRLRRQLERLSGLTEAARKAMLKDAHLLDAALATDRIVLSRDEKARTLFRTASRVLPEVGKVHWGNPEVAEEEVVDWLRKGAKVEVRRTLGAKA